MNGVWPFAVGDRVVLAHHVDRLPDFMAAKGATGVVEEASASTFAVKLDRHLAGAEEWDNRVEWYADGGGGGLGPDAAASELRAR